MSGVAYPGNTGLIKTFHQAWILRNDGSNGQIDVIWEQSENPFPKKKLIAIGCKFKKPVGIEKVCNRIGCKFSMIQRRVPQSSEWKTHLCACVCTCLQHGVQAARTRTHTHHSHTQTHHTPTQFRRALDSPDRYRLFK